MVSVIRLVLWLPLCLLILGLGTSAGQAEPPKKVADKPKMKLPALLAAKPLKESPKDDAMRKLLKARYNEAVSEAREYYSFEQLARENGIALLNNQDGFYATWHRVVYAGLDLCGTPAEKVTLLRQYRAVAKEAEENAQRQYDAGRIRIGHLHRARYERLDADIRVLRAKREVETAKAR